MSKISEKIKGLPSMAMGIFNDVKDHWKVPKKGDYVSYKEFVYLVLGVSGNNSYSCFANYIFFAAGCLLVGSIYGIAYKDIYYIGLIGMPLGYIMTPINMLVTDNLGDLPKKSGRSVNAICIPMLIIGIICYFIPQIFTESFMPALPQIVGTILTSSVFNVYFKMFVLKKLAGKFGKFRCWIVAGVVPAMIMVALIIYIPFEKNIMPYYTKLWVLHLLFSYFGIFNVFSGQVGNIQNVISPSTEERTKIISYGSLLWSAIPSLVLMILPVFASMSGGFTNILTYRTVFPPFMAVFAGITLIVAFKVHDKVLLEKNHKPQINFIEGSKSVMKNKYFWITNISALMNCVTAGSVAMLNIFFIYVTRQDWLMGVYAGIVGTAYVPGMLLAPFIIKRVGKRNLMLMSKVIGIVSLIGSIIAINTNAVVLFIVINYLCTLFMSPTSIATQAMGADQWDYQQYLTGERLDGFSGIFGLILNPITTLGGYLIPFLYALVGFTSDWDIMYVPELRFKIITITAIVSLAAGILSMIPYFFYDLTEEKHKKIIETLTQRAEEKEEENAQQASVEV
ncbi:MAG: MFS transporter [Oscillospiraceae bacterium]